MKRLILIFYILAGVLSFAVEDLYVGYWMMPDEKFVIEIEKEGDIYVGYVRWLKEQVYPAGDSMEGIEQRDRNNPDINLRDRRVMGLQVVGDLYLYEDDGELKGGWIYDSWNGHMYHGSASLVEKDTLKLKGSIDRYGIIGYSMKAKRVKRKKTFNSNKGKDSKKSL